MFSEGPATVRRVMNSLSACTEAESGVSTAGASLNPFGSTLLQNAAFGSLPGAARSAEPQIGISDFQ